MPILPVAVAILSIAGASNSSIGDHFSTVQFTSSPTNKVPTTERDYFNSLSWIVEVPFLSVETKTAAESDNLGHIVQTTPLRTWDNAVGKVVHHHVLEFRTVADIDPKKPKKLVIKVAPLSSLNWKEEQISLEDKETLEEASKLVTRNYERNMRRVIRHVLNEFQQNLKQWFPDIGGGVDCTHFLNNFTAYTVSSMEEDWEAYKETVDPKLKCGHFLDKFAQMADEDESKKDAEFHDHLYDFEKMPDQQDCVESWKSAVESLRDVGKYDSKWKTKFVNLFGPGKVAEIRKHQATLTNLIKSAKQDWFQRRWKEITEALEDWGNSAAKVISVPHEMNVFTFKEELNEKDRGNCKIKKTAQVGDGMVVSRAIGMGIVAPVTAIKSAVQDVVGGIVEHCAEGLEFTACKPKNGVLIYGPSPEELSICLEDETSAKELKKKTYNMVPDWKDTNIQRTMDGLQWRGLVGLRRSGNDGNNSCGMHILILCTGSEFCKKTVGKKFKNSQYDLSNFEFHDPRHELKNFTRQDVWNSRGPGTYYDMKTVKLSEMSASKMEPENLFMDSDIRVME